MHFPTRFCGMLPRLTLAAAFAFPFLALPAAANEPSSPASQPAPAPLPAALADIKPSAVENALVKIFSTVRRPDLGHPWTKGSPQEITASGVVIEGRRILTNAHAVLYASQVQVRANQSGDKLSATVEAVAPGIDLAVLKLEDESFFETHPPLERAGALPQIKDPVLVYGYPVGGTSLSITKGIVSRIEFTSYNFPVSGLRVQIDAAINPGNSGGPALVGDKMIGLAFSHVATAQNIGYIIPCEEIELFLKDIADGHYDGKPALFDECNTLESPALRAFLKLDKSVEGAVVREVFSADPSYPLKQWDVITKIGGTAVDDQGMIKLGDNLRVRFTYLVQKLAQDGKVAVTVIRAGKELAIPVPVSPTRPRLIPFLQGTYPSYFIFGPIVFSPAADEFISTITAGTGGSTMSAILSFQSNPLITRRGDQPAFAGEELVVVPAPFFPHKLSKGFVAPVSRVVKSINGVAVRNFRQLVELLRDSTAEFIVIEFVGHGVETIVLPRIAARAATEEILTDSGIRAQGSADALAVWHAKAP